MKKFILFISLAFFAINASAQLSRSVSEELHTHVEEYDVIRSKKYVRIYFGPTAPFVNTDKAVLKSRYYDNCVLPSQTISPLLGGSLGFMIGMPIHKTLPLYLETGLRASYTWAEGTIDVDEENRYVYADANFEELSLMLPLNLTYRIPIGERKYFAPFIGVHAKACSVLDDNMYVNASESYNLDIEDDFIFNYGIQLGVNLDLKWFHLGFNWEPSFISHKLEDGDGNSVDTYAQNINVTLGFVIQKKKKVLRR